MEPAISEKVLSSEPKREDKPYTDKKGVTTPMAMTDSEEERFRKSKEAPSIKDTSSLSESKSKDQEGSKQEKESTAKSEIEDNKQNKAE